MNQPPNLRVHDDPKGGPIRACGNCKHYGFDRPYDPAASRDVGGRRKVCKLYGGAEVSPSEVCDSYSRAR